MLKNKYLLLKIFGFIISLLLIILILIKGFNNEIIVVLDSRCTKLKNQISYEEQSFEIIKKIQKKLSYDKRFKTVLTCNFNRSVYLDERIDIIEKINPNIVINIEYDDSINDYEIYPSVNVKESLSLSKSLNSIFSINGLNGDIYYYYLPLIKKDIHVVKKVKVEEGLKDEITLKLFDDLKYNTVVLAINNEEVIEYIYEGLKEYFNLK